MTFSSKNYFNSQTYNSYKTIYDSKDINFEAHSPYVALEKNLNSPIPSIPSLSDDPTFYFNNVSRVFASFVCADSQSSIKNKNKTLYNLRVPFDKFTNGEIFGIKKVLDSIIAQVPLKDPPTPDNGWKFSIPSDFDGTSKTDDIEKVLEIIFYKTYFSVYDPAYSKFFKGNIKKLPKQKEYFSKGESSFDTVTGKETYNPGKGEAPNFLNVSANSYQKVKNKVLIRAEAIRTDYESNIFAPKQIYFKDNKEELLSGFIMEDDKILKIKKIILSSVSQSTLDEIIDKYFVSVCLYFNLIHYILKDAIISFEFFKFYASETNIFSLKGTGTAPRQQKIKDVEKKYADNELIKNLGIYTKELIINLLNLVGDESAIENTCSSLLDYLEEKRPEIIGLYNKKEFLDILKQINSHSFQIYANSLPGKSSLNFKKNEEVPQTVQTILFKDTVVHSNDLILQDVIVYRTLDKPNSYEEILQDRNIYKTIKLDKLMIGTRELTRQSSVSLVDNVETNKKYYYCFLSQREYDVYKEIDLSIADSRLVKHLSSPTKVLELEMISTDNSTYLEYNFFVPEVKEFFEKKKNFLSKIKVVPSPNQKIYDKESGKFFFDSNNLIKLWKNTTKPIDSNDLATGSTIKLRISSPKTNKKIDINLRYFLNDQIDFGTQFKEVTEREIKELANGKKYVQVSSLLQPEIIFSMQEKDATGKFVDLKRDAPEIKDNVKTYSITYGSLKFINYTVNMLSGSPKFVYKIDNISSLALISDPNAPSIKNYLSETKGNINIFSEQLGQRTNIGSANIVFLNDNRNLYNLENINLIVVDPKNKTQENKILIKQYIKDKFGFEYTEQTYFPTSFLEPKIKSITPSTLSVSEGSDVVFEILTENISDDEILNWEIATNASTSDFSNSFNGTVKIKNNRATVTVKVIADNIPLEKESFQLKVSKSFGNLVGLAFNISPLVTIIDTTPTFNVINNDFGAEGQPIVFNINTTNFEGPLTWKIEYDNIAPALLPILGPITNYLSATNGTVQVTKPSATSSDGVGKVTINTFDLLKNQGNINLRFLLTTPTAGIIKKTFILLDIPRPTITSNVTSVNEGGVVDFKIQIPDNFLGKPLYYEIQPASGDITTGDISGLLLSTGGPIVQNTLVGSMIPKFNQEAISVSVAEDNKTEGLESFRLVLRTTQTGAVISESPIVNINDTSLEPYYITSLKKYLLNNSGGTILNPDLTATITARANGTVSNPGKGIWGGAPATPYYTEDSDFRKAVLHAFPKTLFTPGVKEGDVVKVQFKFIGLSTVIGSLSNGIQTISYSSKDECWSISKI